MPSHEPMIRRALLGMLLALAACAPADARFEGGPLGSSVVRCPTLPSTIDLGQVPVGGDGSVRLPGLPVDVTLETTGAFTAQRDGDDVVLGVRPVSAGQLEGTLTASAPRCEPATSRLVAQGMARCLELAPSLRFQDTERSCGSVTATLDVHNRCDVGVALHGGGVTEPDDGADAWCAGGPPCVEFGLVGGASVLAPNTTSALTLRFSPANSGARLGSLRLDASEHGGVASYEVALDGTGLPRATLTESFQQSARPQGDVLLILDTSPAMQARRMANAQNFHSYAAYLISSQLDVQVTVASAGRALVGRDVGSVNSRDPDFEAKFTQLLAALPPGSDDTSCMEQALAHFEASPSFRRPGVPAGIICVTMRPDRTEGAWLPLVGRFLTRFDTPPAQIIGPFHEVSGCVSTLDDGRLAQWSNATNGVREEICTPDWATALEDIGKNAFGWFFRASPSQPVLRIVEVTVNGVSLPPIDSRGAGIWSWDAATAAVIFEPLYVPEPGQLVTVTYEPRCP